MKRFILSAVWIGFLFVFVLLGVPYASYHGDETSHLYNSHDYAILFIDRNPQALLVDLPIDTEREYLRLADSTIARYSMGLAWHLAGYRQADLPQGNFNWFADYAGNQALGRIPDQHLMVVVRLPSAIFLALSAVVMFGIGYRFGGLKMAFFVSGLYIFNPVILLNGRRALQEGSLLFFGLLTVLTAIIISQRRENRTHVPFLLWVCLTVAAAFTLLSKNNGFVYVAAAFLWVLLPEFSRSGLRSMGRTVLSLALSGVFMLLLFVAFSPGLWSDPLMRIRDASVIRLAAINQQVMDDPEAPTTLERRVADIFTQPFIRPMAHYDAGASNLFAAQEELIAAYEASPLSGIHFGVVFGVPLTLLACFGMLVNFMPRIRRHSPALALGLTSWLLLNVGVLLLLPLPWQRYFLALIPVMVVFVAIGLWGLFGLLRPVLRLPGANEKQTP